MKKIDITERMKNKVQEMIGFGASQDLVALELQISPRTLHRYFRKELDGGAEKANTRIAGVLYKKALAGDVACMIFWLKTRAKWRETDRLEVSVENRASVVVLPHIYESVEDWVEAGRPAVPGLDG